MKMKHWSGIHLRQALNPHEAVSEHNIHASVDVSEYERGAASPQANSLTGKTNAAGRSTRREPDHADLY